MVIKFSYIADISPYSKTQIARNIKNGDKSAIYGKFIAIFNIRGWTQPVNLNLEVIVYSKLRDYVVPIKSNLRSNGTS
jgi:hypothetical protein